jgi:hypothetical protein
MIDRRAVLASGTAMAGTLLAPAMARDLFDPAIDHLRHAVDEGALPFASLRIASPNRPSKNRSGTASGKPQKSEWQTRIISE